jgi:methylated-DNA-[protein]-cysteine S-methyltransferase
MDAIGYHETPLGRVLLAADAEGLVGLWLPGQKYFASGLAPEYARVASPHLDAARHWLDVYFTGQAPAFVPPLHFRGTPFQQAVWRALLKIPYGRTTTYGRLAHEMAADCAWVHPAARAVGGAVGRNRIAIIVPCHRVVGADGGLTGYAGGLDAKAALLTLEGAMRPPGDRPIMG